MILDDVQRYLVGKARNERELCLIEWLNMSFEELRLRQASVRVS